MAANPSNTAVSKIIDPSDENDQIGILGLYEEDKTRFGPILRTMNLKNIPDFASNIRQYGHPSMRSKHTRGVPESCLISCKVIYPPLCGSFHVVFPIEFADGVMWMLKISANGNHFDSVAAAALVSEARTMQMLKTETSIPVPAVYAFDTSPNNGLSCPFVLMEKVCGAPLSYQWFNSEVPKARLEHFRVKVLQSLAGVMVQLNKFTLHTGGALVFDPDGAPIGLGGAKVMDAVATFNKAAASQGHREHQNQDGKNLAEESLVRIARSNAPKLSGGTQGNDNRSDDEDITWERGPFSCPKAYFLSNLDRSDPAFRADAYEQGTDMSLRLFIEWAFTESQNQDRRFVLTHPDLDVQNILVAEDGTVTGLIDWDGVAAVPREVGCAQYPLWLMRDWVPSRYRYDIEKGQPFADVGYEESSPAQLASYRATYAHFMGLEIQKMTGGPDKATTLGTLPQHEARLTRRSLVMRSLDLSAGDPWSALETVNHIIDQIEELTAPEWDDTDSDMDSTSSCSSVGDFDSAVDSAIKEENKETEAREVNKHEFRGIEGVGNTNQADQESEGMEPSLSEGTTKVDPKSWEVIDEDYASQISAEVSQTDAEHSKAQELSKKDLQGGSSKPSSILSWTRTPTRCGCSTAETFFRSRAEMGCSLEKVVDEVAMLTEVEKQHAEAFVKENLEQGADANAPQQAMAVTYSENFGTKQLENIASSQDTQGPEQLNDSPPMDPSAGLQENPSSLEAVGPEQIKGRISLPSTVQPQDIPLRKAELLQAATLEKKAERKAHYLADKAAIKKELKVWENIALVVWCRGVSLEQLQLNQGKIADWVVDTFRAKRKHEDDLLSALQPPSTAEATTAAAKMADSSVNALNSIEDDLILSKEESEGDRFIEDMLLAAKVDRDERLEKSKTADASTPESGGLDSKTCRLTPKKQQFSEMPDIAEVENSPFEIFEESKGDPELSTTIPSSIQTQAGPCHNRISRTSKAFGNAKKMTKSTAIRVDERLHVLADKAPSLKVSTDTTLSKDSAPVNQPALPSEKLASGLHIGRKNIADDRKSAWNLTNAMEVQQMPGSYPDFEDDDVLQYAKATHKFRALCKSWTSYFTQVIFSPDQFKLDKESSSSDSSVTSDNGDEEIGSDVGGAQSSATSLSDGQAEDEDNQEVKEAKDNNMGSAVTTTGECGSGEEEHDAELDEEKFEGDGMRNAEAKMDHHSPAVFTEVSLKEQLPRRVYDPCSGEWAEANKFDKAIKAANTAAMTDGVHDGEAIDTGDSECEADKENDDDKDNRAAEDEVDETSSDSEPPEFEDNGRFEPYTICNLLGMGELDELRLLRLKEGFLKLLEQY